MRSMARYSRAPFARRPREPRRYRPAARRPPSPPPARPSPPAPRRVESDQNTQGALSQSCPKPDQDTDEEADTVGCCSLRVEHVFLDRGENQLHLQVHTKR